MTITVAVLLLTNVQRTRTCSRIRVLITITTIIHKRLPTRVISSEGNKTFFNWVSKVIRHLLWVWFWFYYGLILTWKSNLEVIGLVLVLRHWIEICATFTSQKSSHCCNHCLSVCLSVCLFTVFFISQRVFFSYKVVWIHQYCLNSDLTCALWNFVLCVLERSSCLSPELPYSPNSVNFTAAFVPAPSLSPVSTYTSYARTVKKGRQTNIVYK